MDDADFGSSPAWKSNNVKVRNYKAEVSDSILRSNLSWLVFIYIFCRLSKESLIREHAF